MLMLYACRVCVALQPAAKKAAPPPSDSDEDEDEDSDDSDAPPPKKAAPAPVAAKGKPAPKVRHLPTLAHTWGGCPVACAPTLGWFLLLPSAQRHTMHMLTHAHTNVHPLVYTRTQARPRSPCLSHPLSYCSATQAAAPAPKKAAESSDDDDSDDSEEEKPAPKKAAAAAAAKPAVAAKGKPPAKVSTCVAG